jgi:hypothetical protein
MFGDEQFTGVRPVAVQNRTHRNRKPSFLAVTMDLCRKQLNSQRVAMITDSNIYFLTEQYLDPLFK